jgi:hypothetical protein
MATNTEKQFEQLVVEAAGGKYRGIEEGLVWFDDPKTDNTLVVTCNELLSAIDPVVLVKEHIESKRKNFRGLGHE